MWSVLVSLPWLNLLCMHTKHGDFFATFNKFKLKLCNFIKLRLHTGMITMHKYYTYCIIMFRICFVTYWRDRHYKITSFLAYVKMWDVYLVLFVLWVWSILNLLVVVSLVQDWATPHDDYLVLITTTNAVLKVQTYKCNNSQILNQACIHIWLAVGVQPVTWNYFTKSVCMYVCMHICLSFSPTRTNLLLEAWKKLVYK